MSDVEVHSPPPHGGAAVSARADDTREKLLDAAAGLFAERGYAGTSIRAVTQAAGVSVSAANYHFGTKRELLAAVCQRRVGPTNELRLRQLDELDRRLAGAAPELEELLRIFLEPVVLQSADEQQGTREVAARLFADPPEIVSELKAELFGPVRDRMVPLLARALPGQRTEEVELGFQFTIGVMVHVVGGHLESNPFGSPPAGEAVLDRLIAYCAAGLRSRPAERETS